MWFLGKDLIQLNEEFFLNGTAVPNKPIDGNIQAIIDLAAEENPYITPVGCKGILRRKKERGLSMNPRLEKVLQSISSNWTDEEIEVVSRKQKRGRFSTQLETNNVKLSLWDD